MVKWLSHLPGMQGGGFESHSRHTISHYHHLVVVVAVTIFLYKLCTEWLVNLPCVCVCKSIACMYVNVSINRLTNVVVCIYFSGKDPHRQVVVGRVVAKGNLGDVMVSTLAQNARGVGSIPDLGAICPVFIIPTTIH